MVYYIVLRCLYHFSPGLVKPSVKAVDFPLALISIFRFCCLNTETLITYLSVDFDVVLATYYWGFRRVRNFAKSDHFLRHVHLSVCPSTCNNIGCFWIKIWHISIFRKSVEKIQVSLQSEKNNEFFARRLMQVFIISLSVLLRMWNFSVKRYREN
jgi:hypothetical protein